MRRVVVTGLGLVTSVGRSVRESWDALLSGQNGVSEVSAFETAAYGTHVACQIHFFSDAQTRAAHRRFETVYSYASMAAAEALGEASLRPGSGRSYGADRCGVSFATLTGELTPFEFALRRDPSRKDHGFPPEVTAAFPIQSVAVRLAREHGFAGPLRTSVDACSAGNHAIANAVDLIQMGRVDVALAGGVDNVTQTEFTHFHNVRALSPDLCRPFDRNRKGLVLGEGAAALVLEEESGARRRGARIYAEVAGYGLSADGFHMTAPEPEGAGAIRAMRAALHHAAVTVDQVDYISAHGTGTRLNDAIETKAIRAVFGDRAERIPVSSIKSMIGHCMGAASAIEAVVSCLTLAEGRIPPTANYRERDPACDLDYVTEGAREIPVRVVMSNAFAFGGNNAIVMFRAWP